MTTPNTSHTIRKRQAFLRLEVCITRRTNVTRHPSLLSPISNSCDIYQWEVLLLVPTFHRSFLDFQLRSFAGINT